MVEAYPCNACVDTGVEVIETSLRKGLLGIDDGRASATAVVE
jgi:hypothetical protein